MGLAVTSETEIVNFSLARLGEEAIYSIDDDNKRARLCKRLYKHSANFVLAYNWPFARRINKPSELSELTEDDKLYTYVHQLPADNHHVIDLLPIGRKDKWEQVGQQLHSHLVEPRVLYITRNVDVIRFSAPFVNSVYTYLASMLAGPITSDHDLTRSLQQEFYAGLWENIRLDAAIGSQHGHPDTLANNDPFVTGEDNHRTDLTEESKRYLLLEE